MAHSLKIEVIAIDDADLNLLNEIHEVIFSELIKRGLIGEKGRCIIRSTTVIQYNTKSVYFESTPVTALITDRNPISHQLTRLTDQFDDSPRVDPEVDLEFLSGRLILDKEQISDLKRPIEILSLPRRVYSALTRSKNGPKMRKVFEICEKTEEELKAYNIGPLGIPEIKKVLLDRRLSPGIRESIQAIRNFL